MKAGFYYLPPQKGLVKLVSGAKIEEENSGLGVMGVFLAEPISNFLGGGACYITMLRTVWPELSKKEE